MLEDRALLLLLRLLLLHHHLANDLLAAAVGLYEQPLLVRLLVLYEDNIAAPRLSSLLMMQEDGLRGLLYYDGRLAARGGPRAGLQVELAGGGLVELLAAAPGVSHQQGLPCTESVISTVKLKSSVVDP
jgi:hypothetical protein